MQRLHEDDITAHLLAKGGFDHLCLKAIAEEDETTPIGLGRTHHRCKGSPSTRSGSRSACWSGRDSNTQYGWAYPSGISEFFR
jgi:hypothetical protein